jgi:ribose 5-phosphate isomerase A
MSTAESLHPFKEQAAAKAVEFIRPGMVVGLGTGSTAECLIAMLGQRCAKAFISRACRPH